MILLIIPGLGSATVPWALDGFTQTMIAHAETRGRIFDKVKNGLKEFDGAVADKITKHLQRNV